MKKNIAQRTLAYYESEDFKNNYSACMYEQYLDNENEVKDRIKKVLDYNDVEFKPEMVQKIYDHISENFEAFQGTMWNYWVGHDCIESIAFGEQEEQLTGLYNNATGKDYNFQYMKRVFKKEGFVIVRGYAYRDLSDDGLKIDLIMTDEIKAILAE